MNPSPSRIFLLIKSPDFKTVRRAAMRRGIHVFDIAANGGNLGEMRALTGAENFAAVQRWFAEPGECRAPYGYPPGTLLYFRLEN